MKITYIASTLLLLASLAMAHDPEDPKARQLRTKNPPMPGRGGERTLEAKEAARGINTHATKPGRGGERALETKQRPAKNTLAAIPRPPELQMAAATKDTQLGTKHYNPNSCTGHCGGNAGNCYCDDQCVQYGDCCDDVCMECNSPFCTCDGNCNGSAPGGLCWCDSICHLYPYDCCDDACQECSFLPECPSPFSCHGQCDGQAPGGCWCDSICTIPPYDCCSDVCNECSIGC